MAAPRAAAVSPRAAVCDRRIGMNLPSGGARHRSELRTYQAPDDFGHRAVHEVSGQRLQMHLERSPGRRLREAKDWHRDFIRREPQRCAQPCTRPLAVPPLRVRSVHRPHCGAEGVVQYRRRDAKLVIGEMAVYEVARDRLAASSFEF